MIAQLRTAVLISIVLFAITGIVYPALVTGIAQVAFPDNADGSLIRRDGEVIGSSLLGQSFVNQDTGHVLPGYLRGRPSAAGSLEDGTILSGGSNLGPTNAALIERISADIAIIRNENGLAPDAEIPVDLVTASGSGLDPHISPASAEIQVTRIAAERGLSEDEVRAIIDDNTDEPTLGVLGESRVNVLAVNLALDEAAPLAAPAG